MEILKHTFKEFNPRRYLDMENIELQSESNGVRYRLAERSDIVDMLAIERDVYDGEVPWTFSHFEHEIVQNENAFFVVAEVEQKVIGFIGLRVIEKGKNGHISNLAVLRKFQKQGIGSHLIKQMVLLMRALGKKVVTLEVRRDNTEAQGLYRRNGFSTRRLLSKYYEDGGDAVWMENKLEDDEDENSKGQ